MAKLVQSSFARGEIAPSLYGRTDLQQYQTALRRARNMIVHQYGGISNRPGMKFVGPVKDHDNPPRLIPFQFKTTDTHILEFGNEYIRFLRNDGHVTETAVNITGITQASPGVVTATSHGYSNGDEVYIEGVGGMLEINGRRFIVANVSTHTFELTDQVTGANVSTTAFGAYTSGGTVAKIYEIVSPYQQADLRNLKFVQTADIVTIVHPDYHPRTLTRSAINSWTLAEITFTPDITYPTAVTATGGTGPDSGYIVTAISADGEESLPGLGNTPGAATITAITKANPGVVTASSHGFSNGDVVEIASVGGMTELNGRRFTVANEATNTFELQGEDTTNYTTYTSGGTATATYEFSANDTGVSLAWNAVAGAVRYNIYKLSAGVYGFIAGTTANSFTDDGSVTPNLGETSPMYRDPFVGEDNKPGAVGYFQQRMVFGGTNNQPDLSEFSVIGAFDNFTRATPIREDDSFSATLSSRNVNFIEHYVALRDLMVFTNDQEWSIGIVGDSSFSINTIVQRPETNWGCNSMPPIVIGSTVLYVTNTSNAVRGTGYSFQTDNYISNDLSLFVPHLFRNNTVVEWGSVRTPDPFVFLVRDDGQVLVLTFNEEQEVLAWTTWDTDGEFESVACIRPSISDNHEQAYFVVKRTVNGQTVRYIERTHDRQFAEIYDVFFVDSGLTYDVPVTISGVTAADPVVVTANNHGFSNGDEVDIFDINWEESTDIYGNVSQPKQLNGYRYIVANTTTHTFALTSIEDGSDIDGTSNVAYVSGGTVRKAVTKLYGLHHLIGETVVAVCDGNVVKNLTVATDGTVTLPRKFSRVQIGLPFTADLETLDPEPNVKQGTIQASQKKITEVSVRFEKSRGLWVGYDSTNLQEMKQREFEVMGAPTELLTGIKDIAIPPVWNQHGRIFMRQLDPLPLTILAIIIELDVGD